ncbi:hypothetical protein [Streptomyces griseoloalbus]|uniref:Uncharacterized protein n=1 Tax=Streptomyces griseoloalbus TaxID=67303 RepID=A0A7W8BWH1_9ACTN|nr:hypothetical protein [Streptomyces albaduncus]MBB5129833.1 hypothetical protein [Streptomyces albaduncus]GGW82521.1 hypothetical protein GCM10010340_70420 [Streptomyces albaduncus]
MPTQDDYGQGIDLISLTDAPDMAKAIADLAAGVIPRSMLRFASSSERGATLTGPEAGMVTYLEDVKRLDVYDGSKWQAIVSATLPWANVSLASGYKAWEGGTVGPRVRREGSIVYLEGRLQRTSGADIAASDGVTLGTVPTAYRPVGHYAEGFVTLTNSGANTPVGRIEIWHTDGTIRYWSDKATSFVGFSSWWFIN